MTIPTAYIYDAVRTPRGRGRGDGALHEAKPVHLAAGLLSELERRHDLDTSCVGDVILGCVTPVGDQGGNIAKTSAQVAGWHEGVAGVQLERYCGSGLEAVHIAATRVLAGWEDLLVAGGVESMSRVPMGSAGGTWLLDPEFALKLQSVPQGVSADLLATLDGYTREDLDAYALESHRRAAHAQTAGWFDRSVVPVRDLNGLVILERDECIRAGTTMELLGNLKASFEAIGNLGYDDLAIRKYPAVERIRHLHTPGNSSAIADGASAVLIGNELAGRSLGIQPRARIVAGAVLATEPTLMLVGPVPAARKALARAGLSIKDIDLFEINEAFSSVPLRFMKELDIPHEITNVNGGAIALGHPLGATGAMLVSTLLDELERRNLKRGLIALCVAGGMGIATIIERIES